MNKPHLNPFVFEFICGGGWYRYPGFGAPSGSMLREGAAMLDAVVEKRIAEFGTNSNGSILIPLDSLLDAQTGFGWADDPRVQIITVDSRVAFDKMLEMAFEYCDAATIIAPEIENALYDLTLLIENSSLRLLTPNSSVVEIGSDKWLTYCHLRKHRVPTPETALASQTTKLGFSETIIVKPRFGAGSMNVRRVNSNDVKSSSFDSDELIQQFVPGVPASIAIECDQVRRKSSFFPLMKQVFSDDSFHYLRSERIASDGLQSRAEALLHQVVEALPEFDGYLGIDIVLGATPEFDQVIEINPRYTSSFCYV